MSQDDVIDQYEKRLSRAQANLDNARKEPEVTELQRAYKAQLLERTREVLQLERAAVVQVTDRVTTTLNRVIELTDRDAMGDQHGMSAGLSQLGNVHRHDQSLLVALPRTGQSLCRYSPDDRLLPVPRSLGCTARRPKRATEANCLASPSHALVRYERSTGTGAQARHPFRAGGA